MNEVPALVVVLAAQCAEGVHFNLANYLCSEFHANCREAQEQGKTFHYMWILLLIIMSDQGRVMYQRK